MTVKKTTKSKPGAARALAKMKPTNLPETIQVMVVPPGTPLARIRVEPIECTPLAMQSKVGGYIQQLAYSGLPSGVVALVNENGLALKLPFNRWTLVGTFVLVRKRGSAWGSLTTADVKAIHSLYDGPA